MNTRLHCRTINEMKIKHAINKYIYTLASFPDPRPASRRLQYSHHLTVLQAMGSWVKAWERGYIHATLQNHRAMKYFYHENFPIYGAHMVYVNSSALNFHNLAYHQPHLLFSWASVLQMLSCLNSFCVVLLHAFFTFSFVIHAFSLRRLGGSSSQTPIFLGGILLEGAVVYLAPSH